MNHYLHKEETWLKKKEGERGGGRGGRREKVRKYNRLSVFQSVVGVNKSLLKINNTRHNMHISLLYLGIFLIRAMLDNSSSNEI